MPDEFAGSSLDGYDPTRVYTASRDSRGFSEWAKTRVPMGLPGEIGALLSTGKAPEFRSYQDFFRDCLIHGLHKLAVRVDDERFSAFALRTIAAANANAFLAEDEQREDLLQQAGKVAAAARTRPDQKDRAIAHLKTIANALAGRDREDVLRMIESL